MSSKALPLGMELKDLVRLARKHKGWTLVQLADVMGRSKSNVGLWETGNHSPSYDQVQQIAAATGFPLPHEVDLDAAGQLIGLPRAGDGFRGSTDVIGEATVDGASFVWDLNALQGRLSGINADNALAIRIKGDGAHPIIKHHQFLVVLEEGKPSFSELCLVDQDGSGTKILEFLSEQGSSWMFNTLQGQRVTIEKEDIQKVWPVIAITSQSLWRPGGKLKSSFT